MDPTEAVDSPGAVDPTEAVDSPGVVGPSGRTGNALEGRPSAPGRVPAGGVA
ncbi:hypothetical protein [Streptomyces sp. TX20-6-3]|uniref:hypothetical protein n=1 Tax=Streptomyces sp. TX20-6-3 TaxID=3028705 RepID=UPI0029C0B854|nr:hypothetical protein [Streptomyces sp. TX20-6-3]